MAKKTATPKQTTMGWEDQIPKEVQDAADDYVVALRKYNKMKGSVNTAKEVCITAMRNSGVKKVKVDSGSKILELSETENVKLKKIKEPTAAADDDDDDEAE